MVKKISDKFIKGVGSVMDLYPRKSYPMRSYVPGKTDADRLRGDWENVGRSISKAMNKQADDKE